MILREYERDSINTGFRLSFQQILVSAETHLFVWAADVMNHNKSDDQLGRHNADTSLFIQESHKKTLG